MKVVRYTTDSTLFRPGGGSLRAGHQLRWCFFSVCAFVCVSNKKTVWSAFFHIPEKTHFQGFENKEYFHDKSNKKLWPVPTPPPPRKASRGNWNSEWGKHDRQLEQPQIEMTAQCRKLGERRHDSKNHVESKKAHQNQLKSTWTQ